MDPQGQITASRRVQDVIEKFVRVIPESDPLSPDVVHRRGDPEKMLEELGRDVLVNRVLARQLEGGSHHRQAKHSHPTRAVALLKSGAVGKRLAPVKDADVIKPEETAFENIAAAGVFPIYPPGEIYQQLVEDRFKKGAVAFAAGVLLDLINAPSRPADDRRVDVTEVPFVVRDLDIGVLVPFAQNDIELR